MANPFFQFKQFTVFHDKCAMKVGTDGVLIGSWCHPEACHHILDIGTGTGLIALMMAQRSSAAIDAIDIDEGACLQAKENAERSPFAAQINICHTSLEEFAATHTAHGYDLIVSNPPYFNHSLKCPDRQRNQARHTDTLPLHDLLHDARQLLSEEGRLCLILPFDQQEILTTLAEEQGLYLCRQTDVIPTPMASPKRLLVEYALTPQANPQHDSLLIEESRHHYSEAFSALVRDYYLHL